MKRTLIWMVVMGLGTVAFAEAPKKKPGAPSQEEMQKMMAEMEKAAAPGPEHKALQDNVGNWTATSKMYMDPSKPPMESQGTEKVESVLGGRFIQVKFSGNMMG